MVKQLTINTNAATTDSTLDKYTNNSSTTPRTAESTPPSSAYKTVRGQSDIRSPGISKTPSIVKPSSNHSGRNNTNNNDSNTIIKNFPPPPSPTSTTQIPDFITQTDKYGNASTPRTPTAIAQRQQRLQQQEQSSSAASSIPTDDDELDYDIHEHPVEEQEDACDTLLDSFRFMCCCLLPETNTHDLTKQQQQHHHRHHHHHTPTVTHTNSYNNNSYNNTEKKMQITRQRRGGSTGGAVYGHIDERANFHYASEQIKLLPEIVPEDEGKPCLVLDLDETLVHSSFRAVPGADFVIPVQIEDVVHYVYVAKRPGVDEFLIEMAKHYEIILYTASLNKYADPLLDLLDPHNTIRTRLFRESCVYYEGNYVKDLGLLNRDLCKTIIVDNSPSSYIFHPRNAIDCTSFIDDPTDVELDQIGAFLKDIRSVKDVRSVCAMWKDWPNVNTSAFEIEEFVESRQETHVQ